jgi:hypothetical protein
MDKKIIEHVKENTKFLSQYGFSSVIISKKLTDELSYDYIRFKNDYVRIDISFSTFIDSKSLNLTIGLLNKNSSFNFEEFLLYKGQNQDLCIGNKNEEDETYIRRFFTLFQVLVNEDLLDILEGRKWINVPKDYSLIR